MIIEQRKFFFRTLRVILDDAVLRRALTEKKYAYISGLSYDDTLGGPAVKRKSKKTTMIHLDDDYFQNFNDTTRNEIARAQKVSEIACLAPDRRRDEIYALYAHFEQRGGRIVRKKDYFKEHLFAGVYWQQRLVGAILLYDAHPYLRAHAIVSTDIERSDPIYRWKSFAMRRLVYEICTHGKERGYTRFDLGGINISDTKKAGITAFKLGFGGEVINEYTYTYKSALARLFL